MRDALYWNTAKRKRKCGICNNMVPKGTPVQIHIFRAYPRSRWDTIRTTCYKCVVNEIESVSPKIWDMYASERICERDGLIDA